MNDNTLTFGRQLATLLIESGYVRRNNNPDWARFATVVSGVSYETLRKAVTQERPVSRLIMERAAEALNVAPSIFVEYRLSSALRELDPGTVGWRRALATLQSWEAFVASGALATATKDSTPEALE